MHGSVEIRDKQDEIRMSTKQYILAKMEIAMHCNLKAASRRTVVLGFNYDAYN